MLELKHIAKTYKTAKGVKTEALKDINLRFPQRGMVFVLGKSGSGKSTLLNIIGGLDQADAGEIIINGKSSADFKQSDYDSYRNTYVGFIFQEFNLMEEYTIEKNIAMALQLQQKEASHADIEEMLKRLGLSGYAARYPNELSGGQDVYKRQVHIRLMQRDFTMEWFSFIEVLKITAKNAFALHDLKFHIESLIPVSAGAAFRAGRQDVYKRQQKLL